MDWTSGYVSEIDYTHGYYRELAPGLIDYSLLLGGYEPPNRSAMRYLELGYGQGLSANIHAAACPGEFWGTDFNPAHASNAQTLAAIAGSDGQFSDDSFVDFLARPDLPEFNYIVLHGVWSWLNDDNRRAMVDIIRRRLKVGGACYISYNTLPGWAMAMPLRHIMSLHAETAGSEAQGVIGRIDASITFGTAVAEAGARYFADNAAAKGRLETIANQNRNYLAHEYFNRDWAPMYFSEVHDRLSEAKLGYACPASPIDHMDGFNLTGPQAAILNSLPHTVLRETVRDYMVNQQFRRDLHTRGARRLSALERLERMQALRVALVMTASDMTYEVQTPLGKVSLRKEIYAPVIEALAADNARVRTIGELGERPEIAALPPGALIEALSVLISAGYAHPAQSEADIARARPRTDALNAHLIDRSRISGDATWLASPVIGAGVSVGQFEQMFLGARAKGAKTPAAWAKAAWEILEKQNKSIIKNGEILKGAEANLEELHRQAKTMAEQKLPHLIRLGVVT